MGVARANMALPACSAWSNMVETCLRPMRVKLTAPFLGTQQVYVIIKQVVALCSQTPLKCIIAGPPEKVRAICAGEPGKSCFEIEGFLLLLNQEDLS